MLRLLSALALGLSTNWAGYESVPATPAIAATWTIPAHAAGIPLWVGLGGDGCAVLQAGTQQFATGRAGIWEELSPALPVPMPVAVHIGDTVTIGVRWSDGYATLTWRNDTTGEALRHHFPLAHPCLGSAEVIAEDLGAHANLPPVRFSRITLHGAWSWFPVRTPTWRPGPLRHDAFTVRARRS